MVCPAGCCTRPSRSGWRPGDVLATGHPDRAARGELAFLPT
jgi:hypothetical protein